MSDETNQLLREIRDDQREALNLYKSTMRRYRVLGWWIAGILVVAITILSAVFALLIYDISHYE